MKWSLRLGRLLGVEVKVHVTFVLILLWVALISIRQGASLAAALGILVFVLTPIFALFVLKPHELLSLAKASDRSATATEHRRDT